MKPIDYNMEGTGMPMVGLGQAGILEPDSDALIQRTVEKAVRLGYRHFDTAYIYMNEKPIGKALHRCIQERLVSRDELFITTKLPCIGMQSDLVETFLRLSLQNLGLEYVDLYLVHWPIGFSYHGDPLLVCPKKSGKLDLDFSTNLEDIWRAMENVCDKGLTRRIGLSNFNVSQISRILTTARLPPANLQVELNVYLQQPYLVEYCKAHGISICAYAPLGSPGRMELCRQRGQKIERIIDDPEVLAVANSHGRTPAQILLRFLVQQGIAVIPRTTKPDRLQSNFNVFDFELTAEDMKHLRSLDRGSKGRIFDFSSAPEGRQHPEFPF